MSWFKKKETPDESIQKMNNTSDLLRKRQDLLLKKMDKEQEQAKIHMKKGKEKKKKKIFLNLILSFK